MTANLRPGVGAVALCLLMSLIRGAQGQGLERFLTGVAGVEVARGANLPPEYGTGFVVSVDGTTLSILTARHLCYVGRERFTYAISVTFYLDKLHPYPAAHVTDSPKLDVAVLKVENVPQSLIQQLPTFSVRPDGAPLSIGDTLHVFGGKSQSWQVSTDTISDVGDGDSTEGFRFDGNGIRGGFSGAPVLDAKGLLTGVHLGATDDEGIYGRAMRMSKAYEVPSRRLGVTMNKLNVGEALVSDNPAPQPGTVKVNPKDGLKYVWIPPGTFMMGCSPGDNECFDDEKPAHQVTITKGFWLGQTAVTQAAWRRVMRRDPSHFKGDSLPVEGVTWDESKRYCEAIRGRLPTEAEWEYAARAGTTGVRYGGLDAVAWYGANSGNQTHPVGMKEPNAWKLYDMLGNVFQWTADRYGKNYYDQRQGRDPQGPPGGDLRTRRGGSWEDNPGYVRLSKRDRGRPGDPVDTRGCRCVGE